MALEIRNLTKTYEDVVAVQEVSLTVEDEFLVLVGPSGSGKTTTLRMIAGLEFPTSGQILIEGEDVTDREPADRDIAMVFQDYALYPHMSVEENMGLALTVAGMPDDEVSERVEQAAQVLGIGELLDRRPSELSGGQQQRVALGRSMVRDPAVFLMDEPLSNLDAKLRTQMRKELEELHDRLGTTFVYVTHDQEEAMTLGDRIAVLDHGEIQQLGTPEDLYDTPQNEFVAGFIGSPSMNMFDCEVLERTDEGTRLRVGTLEYTLDGQLGEKVAQSTGTLRFGIRPEDVVVGDDGAYEAAVNVVEPIGSQVVAYLNVGELELTVRADRDGTIQSDSSVHFDFPSQAVHLFEDGERLA